LCMVLVPACGDAEIVLEVPDEETAVAPADLPGEQTYRNLCAMCHGDSGDGNGIVVLDRPARSFLEGGFSFGNTPEAVARTVANGIGGTPMPGFASSLSPEEIADVSAYVIGLGPEQIQVAPGSTVLAVTDRPQIVRGGFPPVKEGLGMSPRGLLLGGLDGLSFQYDAEHLRLLAVRQGGFVDRKDWGNRGGDSLEPLGKPIYLMDGGDPGEMWFRYAENGSTEPLQARLRATEVQQGSAGLEYELLLDDQVVAEVRETGAALSLGGWSGFRRTAEVLWTTEERVPLDLSAPAVAVGEELFPEQGGETYLVEDPVHGPTVFHRVHKMSVHAQDRFTLTADTLFGLPATEENLAPLEELLP
ncbi:MAG: c-type cytochrome, partial [Planctomycetota bacterium]